MAEVVENWSAEVKCLGTQASNNMGCGATIKIHKEDLYRVTSQVAYDEQEHQVFFCCPACGTETQVIPPVYLEWNIFQKTRPEDRIHGRAVPWNTVPHLVNDLNCQKRDGNHF